jgi:hypothetical protein
MNAHMSPMAKNLAERDYSFVSDPIFIARFARGARKKFFSV